MAFWDVAGEELKVALIGIPMTYPTWPVNGIMVSGFPLPDYTRNHIFPPDLDLAAPPILEHADHVRDLSDGQLAGLGHKLIDRQMKLTQRFINDPSYDVVFVVFQATDFAQHRLWKYLRTNDHPLRESLLQMYRKIDAFVGEVTSEVALNANVLVVSDHGFRGHASHAFNTNVILANAGLLTPSDTATRPRRGYQTLVHEASLYARHTHSVRTIGKRLMSLLPRGTQDRLREASATLPPVIWSETAAYRIPLCPPLEGILINLQGRQPDGTIAKDDYEETRDRAIAAISEFRDRWTQEPVVEWAKRREEVWPGARTDGAPDVIVSLKPQFQGSAGLSESVEPFPSSELRKYSGVHAPEGIIRMTGPNVTAGVNLGDRSLVDVGATIFALLGISPDIALDGEPLSEALHDLPRPHTGSRIVERPDPESEGDSQSIAPRKKRLSKRRLDPSDTSNKRA